MIVTETVSLNDSLFCSQWSDLFIFEQKPAFGVSLPTDCIKRILYKRKLTKQKSDLYNTNRQMMIWYACMEAILIDTIT